MQVSGEQCCSGIEKKGQISNQSSHSEVARKSDTVAAQEGNADVKAGIKKMVGLRKSVKLTGQGAPIIPGKRPKKSKMLFPYEEFVEFFQCEVFDLSPRGLLNCGNSCYANAVLQFIGGCLDSIYDCKDLDGEKMYRCARCASYVRARKQLRIYEAPNVLTIVLKRFQEGRYGKINKWITFPDMLDMIPFMTGTGDMPPLYMLYAVVNVYNSIYMCCVFYFIFVANLSLVCLFAF